MHKIGQKNRKNNCRLVLKSGSAVFLLFFTVFSAAAPAASQIASVLFLFFIAVFSQLLPGNIDHAPQTSVQDCVEIAEIESAEDTRLREIIFIQYPDELRTGNPPVKISKVITQPSSVQPPVAEVKISSPPEILHNNYFIKYRRCCLPVRAGPGSVNIAA